mgnify:CR=1 FL=1
MTKISNEVFIATWKELGSPQAVARELGMEVRNVYRKRNTLLKHGIPLETTNQSNKAIRYDKDEIQAKIQTRLQATRHNARRGITMERGKVVVFSDAHFWPDDTTTAFKALLEMIKEFKPTAVVCNGDALDGASISRFPRMDWSKLPTVAEELEACQYYMGEIEAVAKGAKLFWPLGNHDARFENMLAAHAPQYEQVKGFSLKDHFPAWEPCWSAWPTDYICVKHRWKG